MGCPTARVSVSVHILKGRSFVHLLVWIPQEDDPEAGEPFIRDVALEGTQGEIGKVT